MNNKVSDQELEDFLAEEVTTILLAFSNGRRPQEWKAPDDLWIWEIFHAANRSEELQNLYFDWCKEVGEVVDVSGSLLMALRISGLICGILLGVHLMSGDLEEPETGEHLLTDRLKFFDEFVFPCIRAGIVGGLRHQEDMAERGKMVDASTDSRLVKKFDG